MQVWRNKKTNDLYVITGHCINRTNAQDGQSMVQYKKVNDDIGKEISVREENEFLEKFDFCYVVNL